MTITVKKKVRDKKTGKARFRVVKCLKCANLIDDHRMRGGKRPQHDDSRKICLVWNVSLFKILLNYEKYADCIYYVKRSE